MATTHPPLAEAVRIADHPIDQLFLQRWSPRAMSGAPITTEALWSLFEAARWAPSSYNNQPWRFIYARRETPAWEPFLGLLVEFNREWAHRAAALVVVISKKTFDRGGKPSRTHSFDAGAAWENLALQGTRQGLVVHGMEGFDYDRARTVLHVPDDCDVEAMIAIGLPGDVADLSPKQREREAPSGRKPLDDIVFEARFPAG